MVIKTRVFFVHLSPIPKVKGTPRGCGRRPLALRLETDLTMSAVAAALQGVIFGAWNWEVCTILDNLMLNYSFGF